MSFASLAHLFSRPCRRTLVFLIIWTLVCYALFRSTHIEQDRAKILDPNTYSNVLGSRELLQKLSKSGSQTSGPSGSGDHQLQSVQTSTTEVNVFEVVPAVDNSPPKEEKEVVKELERQLPNLPLAYLHENKGKNWHKKSTNNTSCAKFPALYDLHINNVYWQETDTSNGTFYLYGAYLDRRARNRLGPTLRILGMINRLEPTVKTYCQIWFTGQSEPVISKVLEYKYIWYSKWGNYKPGIFQPYLMACQLPSSHWTQVPISVSVVENECDLATNNLRVIYNVPEKESQKKKFAVCVKGLDFPTDDLSVRLVEWIELLNVLGADKVFLYNLEVHPNVTKVLEHYVQQGKIDVTPLTLPGYQPNMQILQHLYLKSKLNNKRQNEVIPYNDCLYRNMYRYEYIALLDIDEVIMPLKHNNWADMMAEVSKKALAAKNEVRASFNFRNVYFMDSMGPKEPFRGIPPYLHMLQHVYRSANYTKPGQYVKCFHNPEKVLVLHNHFPLACLGGVCTSFAVDTPMGHLQHYRNDCVSTLKKSCNQYKEVSVKDDNIWRFKDEIISRTTDSLSRMGFFRPSSTTSASGSRPPDYGQLPKK